MQRFHRPADTSATRPRTAGAPRTRAAVAAAGLLVICGAPFAGAATGDNLREGVRNGTTSKETEIIANIGTTTAAKGGFAMRMSNLSSTGGGFINGCRASAATTSKPCYRASNLSTGRAFEFNSNNGGVVGTITAGAGGDAKKPFETNATGVATGLNADRVDNLDAAQIVAAARTKASLDADTVDGVGAADLRPQFAQVTAADAVAESRGLAATGGLTHVDGTGIYALLFTGDLSKCAVSATITDATGGEISATPVVAAGNTTVTVRTTDSAGLVADRAFHATVSC